MEFKSKLNIEPKTILLLKKAIISKSDATKIKALHQFKASGMFDKMLYTDKEDQKSKEVTKLLLELVYNSFITDEYTKEVNSIIIKNLEVFIFSEKYMRQITKRIMLCFSFDECLELIDKAAYYIIYIKKEPMSSYVELINAILKRAIKCADEYGVDVEDISFLNDLLNKITEIDRTNISMTYKLALPQGAIENINRLFLETKVSDAEKIKYYIDNFYDVLTEDNKRIAKIIKDIK